MIWNPWRGCHKCSEGCKFCYIHKGDLKRGRVTDDVVLTDKFDYPIRLDKKGAYKMKPGICHTCFQSDFLIEDADAWRGECWRMIKERPDVTFIFLTKRIERFMSVIPADWGEGYDNVVVGATVENQAMVDYKLSIFDELPIKHKNIICQPLIEPVDLSAHLNGVELVVVGGESDKNGRIMDYDWVLSIREVCVERNVSFQFRQCATNFVKDGVAYRLNVNQLCAQARKAGVDFEGAVASLR